MTVEVKEYSVFFKVKWVPGSSYLEKMRSIPYKEVFPLYNQKAPPILRISTHSIMDNVTWALTLSFLNKCHVLPLGLHE